MGSVPYPSRAGGRMLDEQESPSDALKKACDDTNKRLGSNSKLLASGATISSMDHAQGDTVFVMPITIKNLPVYDKPVLYVEVQGPGIVIMQSIFIDPGEDKRYKSWASPSKGAMSAITMGLVFVCTALFGNGSTY
eukprot:Platyproteum_vivax@DN14021_c0_g1_i1.p1